MAQPIAPKSDLVEAVQDWMERLGDLRTRELAKSVSKGEDSGSVISMISGDVHRMDKNMSPMNASETPSKVDSLAGKHACPGCKSQMSPVVAALRKSHGGMCLKCSGMNKGELKYVNNEPQHNQEANGWKPKIKEPYKADGSGGKIKKNPIGESSNDGAKSTDFPMGKAEGMPRPSAPKAPQAPGAQPTHSAGTAGKPSGTPAPKPAAAPASTKMPGVPGMGKAECVEESIGKPLEKPSVSGKQHRAMGAAASGKSNIGIPKSVGEDFLEADKGKKFKKSIDDLHKAIEYTVSLRKAAPGSIKGDMLQGAFQAKPAETGLPAVGKLQPKSPDEYDAMAFRPASPGAAGAPAEKAKPYRPGVPPAKDIMDPEAGWRHTPGAKPFQSAPKAVQGKPALSSSLSRTIAGLRGILSPKPKV